MKITAVHIYFPNGTFTSHVIGQLGIEAIRILPDNEKVLLPLLFAMAYNTMLCYRFLGLTTKFNCLEYQSVTKILENILIKHLTIQK